MYLTKKKKQKKSVFNQNENITPEEKIKKLGNGSVEIVTISLNKLLHCIVVLRLTECLSEKYSILSAYEILQ